MVAFEKTSNIPSEKKSAVITCSNSEKGLNHTKSCAELHTVCNCIDSDIENCMENDCNNSSKLKCEKESQNDANQDSSPCKDNHQNARTHNCDWDQNILSGDSIQKLNFGGKIDPMENSNIFEEPSPSSSNSRTISDTNICDDLEHSNDCFDSENKLFTHSSVKEEQCETKSLESIEDSTSQDTRRTRRSKLLFFNFR